MSRYILTKFKDLLPIWLYDREHSMVQTGPRAAITTLLSIGARANVSYRRQRVGWKTRYARKWVHLGCGGKYVEGWINVDINPLRRIDLWADIVGPLPFERDEVDVVASFHVLEHLDPREAAFMLRECQRILKRGGILRIGVPSLEAAVSAYSTDNWDAYGDMALAFRSGGGRFNIAVLYYGQHKQAFDLEYLAELCRAAGFRHIQRVGAWDSMVVPRGDLEQMQDEGLASWSLFVEARK